MKIRQYAVYRHGSNAANQSMCNLAPVGLWDATSPSEAVKLATQEVTVYNNQFLTARAASSVSRIDYLAASEADYANALRLMELAEWKKEAFSR